MRQEIKNIAVPGGVLVLAGLIAVASSELPGAFAGSVVLAPLAVLGIGTGISLWFNRGRTFIALASILVGFIGYRIALSFGAGGFPVRAVFTGLAIFVPLNILAAILLQERGVTHFRNYRWLLLIAVEALVTAWIAGAGRTALSGTAWHALLDHWLVRAEPTPLLARLLMAAAFIAAAIRAWPERSPLDVGLAGALIAFFIACQWPGSPMIFGSFMFATGTILLLSVLQESHRMAFQDQLTGLPSRRALEERLVALGPVYSIAMVDVDHFKKFNDTHGHDTGDQVLKLVGARLAQIGGGGRAFRYGGEEFAVLFPDKRLAEAFEHLEAMRESIEHYRMATRTSQRRHASRDNNDRRSPTKSALAAADSPPLRTNRPEMLSVTVSIGAAERSDAFDTPDIVIRAADKALYRAKEGGRNRVST
jgi:diguanylate cyclase (GGDEF)-like protein